MPKRRQPFYAERMDVEMSFYDPSIQETLDKRFKNETGFPLMVLRFVDALARATEEESDRFPEVLNYYGKDKEFVSELLVKLTEHHSLPIGDREISRLLLESRYRLTYEIASHRPVGDLKELTSRLEEGDETIEFDYTLRPMEWKDAVDFLEQMLGRELNISTLRTAAKELREKIESLDRKWKDHIDVIERLDSEDPESNPNWRFEFVKNARSQASKGKLPLDLKIMRKAILLEKPT